MRVALTFALLLLCSLHAAVAEMFKVQFVTEPPGAEVHVHVAATHPEEWPEIGKSGEVIYIDPDKHESVNWYGLLHSASGVPTFEVQFRKTGFQNFTYRVEIYKLKGPGVVQIPDDGAVVLKWQPSVSNLPYLLETPMGRNIVIAVAIAIAAALFALNREVRRRRLQQEHVSLISQVLPSPDEDVLINKPFGEYFVTQRLGQGGMASVYRVVRPDNPRGEAWALKVMYAQMAQQPEFVRRFEREVRVTARLVHPNIVRMLDSGVEQGRYYLLMELVEGQTLRALTPPEGFPLAHVVHTVTIVGQALNYAHQQGVIHRDLKPENIMVGKTGELKVMDFGLARTLDATALTVSGAVVGTPSYMAPEQINEGALTAASDQYALGCLIFELLTARPPYVGDTPQSVFMKHCMSIVPSLREWRPDVPEAFDAAARRMLAKDPRDRFPDLLAALKALQEGADSASR